MVSTCRNDRKRGRQHWAKGETHVPGSHAKGLRPSLSLKELWRRDRPSEVTAARRPGLCTLPTNWPAAGCGLPPGSRHNFGHSTHLPSAKGNSRRKGTRERGLLPPRKSGTDALVAGARSRGQPWPSGASEPSWGSLGPWRNSGPAGGSALNHSLAPTAWDPPHSQSSGSRAALQPLLPHHCSTGRGTSLPPSWGRTPISAQPAIVRPE